MTRSFLMLTDSKIEELIEQILLLQAVADLAQKQDFFAGFGRCCRCFGSSFFLLLGSFLSLVYTLDKKEYTQSYEQEVYDLLLEFDEHKTPEARFAYFIDKFDATKTMKHYYDAGKFHQLAWNLKNSAMIRDNDDIQKLVKKGAKNAVDIWFADKYAPYDGDEFFLEAHRILREMNTNIEPPTI